MRPTKANPTSFEEMNLPNTVYKYRDWNAEFHPAIITNQQVFFASPKSFEDSLDCKISIRYDLLTEQDIYDKYLSESKRINSNWTRQQHRAFARDWTKHSPLKDKNKLAQHQIEAFEGFNMRFGVLSLTANPSNNDMWIKYSANHSGFCIGFDPIITFKFFGGGGEVKYYDELPIIYPTPKHDMETQHFLQVFSKLKKWEFEQEYRVHKFHYEPNGLQRQIILPKEAYKEIILGAKIEKKTKEEIIDAVRKDLSHIQIKQASLGEDNKIIIANYN